MSADEGTVLALPPVSPPESTGAGQVNVTLSPGLTKLSSRMWCVSVSPEQTAADWLEITGSGLILTTTFWVLVQPLAVSTYSYVTAIGADVRLRSVSLTPLVPVTGPAGVIPAAASLVHEKVVPAVSEVGVYVNSELLHTSGGVRVLFSAGVGFTVIVNV